MNAPVSLDLDTTTREDKAGNSPQGFSITVRDRRFGRETKASRWWLNGDPVATAWHNALSATFPRGEGLFIDSVKAHRDGAPTRLASEIRAFVKQEVNHTREHIAFNRAAEEAGYDLSEIDRRVAELVGQTREQKPIVGLAVTMALEHFTAMFAHEFLAHPRHFIGAEVEQADLWRWHAVEEIEHKGVAFDTWVHATRDWPKFRRWWVRSFIMLDVSIRFLRHRVRDTLELLEQDGLTGAGVKWRLAKYLLGKPGILRRIFPEWLAYFLPAFHPWKKDDRHLIRLYDSEFQDAVLPAE